MFLAGTFQMLFRARLFLPQQMAHLLAACGFVSESEVRRILYEESAREPLFSAHRKSAIFDCLISL
jgi:hypothetical protein